jgi:uncharacterized protein YraI
MTCLRLMMIFLLMLFAQSVGFAQNPSSFSCNFAKVRVTSDMKAAVSVRTGAGMKFRQIAKLRAGQGVYICDESGGWFKVFYSKPGGPCGSTSESGLDVEKAKGCRSGWVEKRSIDVISG